MELHDRLEEKFRIDVNQKRALNRLKLFTVHDLLFHFPVRYSDVSTVKRIEELMPGEVATVYGKVSKLKTKKAWRSKMPMAEGQIEDLSGKIKIIWYNQAYLAKMLHDSESVKLTGKVTGGKRGMYLANPEFERTPNMPIDSHDSLFKPPRPSGTPPKLGGEGNPPLLSKEVLRGGQGGLSYPISPETRGIPSKWFYHAMNKILSAEGGSASGGKKFIDTLIDYIPEEILKKYNLPTLKTALIWIHKPKKASDAEAARKIGRA